ncbi:ankyrin repeat domain-containing protein [Helicobacter trogontum]|uniref:Ankyrin repeat domain-containing protein n=1 Tax=Helicobacter trogontum TaxID=50960 RepID=A0A4U8S2U5_9HELI|nr:ankyrin repeat domain-containing protein [Helicobacter trogontum]TLD80019.1 ankyrin repeat domain-containing protein [Helicobacter trogontum]
MAQEFTEQLFKLIAEDNDTKIKELLDSMEFNLNSIVYEDEYIMEHIMKNHAPKSFKLLLEYGLNPNILPREVPPLQLGILTENHACVKILVGLKNFMHLNQSDGADDTALNYAVIIKDLDMIHLLIESGADIYRRNYFGESVLDQVLEILQEMEDDDKDKQKFEELAVFLREKGVLTSDSDEEYDDEDDDEYYKTRAQYGYLPTDEYAGLYTLTASVPTALPKNYEVEGVENPQQEGAGVPYYLSLVARYDGEFAPLGVVSYEEAITYLVENEKILEEDEEYYYTNTLSSEEIESMYDYFEI